MSEPREVMIIGSGIAGLTAAIYTARARLDPVVVEGDEPGGQLTLTTIVENYPGFPEGVDGFELMQRMRDQAERFGTDYVSGRVTDADFSERPFRLTTGGGEEYRSKTVIIASGARARLLEIPGEDEFMGKGVSTCATCDGAFYRDSEVVVVGGGDSAMEESIFLTRFASRIHVVHRRDELRASKIMQERASKKDEIEFIWNTEVKEVLGDPEEGFEGVRLVNNENGEEREFSCDGLFLAIGHIPNTGMLNGQIDTDGDGYIIADGVETNIEGVFVAGDVADRRYQQAVTAAGTGCRAAMEAEAFLESEGG